MSQIVSLYACPKCGNVGCYEREFSVPTLRCDACQMLFDKALAGEYRINVGEIVHACLPQKWNPNGAKTVVFDFNGVVDLYQGWNNGQHWPVNPGAESFFRELRRQGYQVVIQTAANLADVCNQLEEMHILGCIDLVTNKKVPAIVYVDDRAIRFNGHFDTKLLDAINNFRTWWETDEFHERMGSHNGKASK